jgi:phospholipid-translocating ATPase
MVFLSLRVNMDMAKSFYAYSIQQDESIKGTVVRSTTIPEDLGRISYLLTDKTGTLTQNEMVFKRLVLATCQVDSADEIKEKLKKGLRPELAEFESHHHQKINEVTRITEAVKALGVCHNVTPVYEENGMLEDEETVFGIEREATYQASSPDEASFVLFV